MGPTKTGLFGARPEVLYAIAQCQIGCVTNVVILEHIMRLNPKGGTLMTFLQFLFCGLEGVISGLLRSNDSGYPNLTLPRRTLPSRQLFFVVFLYWFTNWTNNLVFAYKISLPFHTIFRSCSLTITLLCGVLFLGKRYSWQQVMSVIVLTAGVLWITWLSSIDKNAPEKTEAQREQDFWTWMTGIGLLCVTTVSQSCMSVAQENLVRKRNENQAKKGAPSEEQPVWKEMLMYQHLCGLPLFLFSYKEIAAAVTTTTELEMWPYMAASALTQYVCLRGVNQMIAATDSLTCSVMITVRKFISLLLSVLLFGNFFSYSHWVASFVVFTSSFAYSTLGKKKVEPIKKSQ